MLSFFLPLSPLPLSSPLSEVLEAYKIRFQLTKENVLITSIDHYKTLKM